MKIQFQNNEWFRSIRIKFILLFLLVIMPLVFLLFYNNNYAKNVVEGQAIEAHETTLANFVKQTDDMMTAAERYLINVQQQELDVNSMDLSLADQTNYTLTKVRVSNRFNINQSYMTGIDTLMLYSLKNKEAVISSNQTTEYEGKLEAANHLMKERSELQPVPQRGLLDTTYYELNGIHYLIRIYNASSTLQLGAWFNLNNLLESLNIKNSVILDKNGTTLVNEGLTDGQLKWIKQTIDSNPNDSSPIERTVTIDHEQHLFIMKSSASMDLRYVILIPSSDIVQKLSFFQKVILLIPAAIVLIIILYLVFMQRILIRPMQQIIGGMRRLSHGNFDLRLDLNASTEFQYMTSTFNNMAEEIKSLKLFIYEEKLRVQQAEMKQLQMQINPHFYANSLNIINGMAQLHDFHSVQEMTRLLAAYFRFVTTSSRQVITLREEIEHIRNYLAIQKYRYPSALLFDVQLSQDLELLHIPPLTVQPFIENAIIHGFRRKINPFTIRLHAEWNSFANEIDQVILVIEDNGAGVSEEQLNNLQLVAQQSHSDNKHLGIWNALRRLKLYYGDDQVSCDFEHAEKGGLKIIMTIPFRSKSPN
ncbi:sensor histidine kinase [Paenibacillus glycanilyticus]|uniref:sensor histidine kinase n=1 Tax=Paenibacillus glycanilyticus TaxID=126569 RepID=UPI003EBE44D8